MYRFRKHSEQVESHRPRNPRERTRLYAHSNAELSSRMANLFARVRPRNYCVFLGTSWPAIGECIFLKSHLRVESRCREVRGTHAPRTLLLIFIYRSFATLSVRNGDLADGGPHISLFPSHPFSVPYFLLPAPSTQSGVRKRGVR